MYIYYICLFNRKENKKIDINKICVQQFYDKTESHPRWPFGNGIVPSRIPPK